MVFILWMFRVRPTRNAAKYRRLFKAADLEEIIRLPIEIESRHIYNQFIIHCARGRDKLRDFLTQHQIGTEIYYPLPMHQQACFADLGYQKGDFPQAEDAAQKTLALPIYPELEDKQLEYVVQKIAAFYRN